MNHKKYTWIFYIITTTILLTIVSQVYWNYKNYQVNKQQFVNDVQVSLDNAVSSYFAEIAKTDFLTFIDIEGGSIASDSITVEKKKDSIFICNALKRIEGDTLSVSGFTQILASEGEAKAVTYLKGKGLKKMSVFTGKKALDSLAQLQDSLQMLRDITTIYVSIQRDSFDLIKMSELLTDELDRKSIPHIPYSFRYYKNDSIVNKQTKEFEGDYFSTFTNATFLAKGEQLELLFADQSRIILLRGLTGILLSFLLSLVIISSLFYLLHIIKKQKELALIKNDLISNITHEFKTPITAASTALEALTHFDALQNREKTQDYIEISSNQLKKLHLMVEKLLETATLDSENLMLQKERVELVDFVRTILQRQEHLIGKKILFTTTIDELFVDVDLFHLENVLNNLIDNASKYGGDSVEVCIKLQTGKSVELRVIDNGNGIEKSQQVKVFDKFYRVPKGNTHDVKGFGIGLYYAKIIIEKHKGTIRLTSNQNQTIFKIELPL